MLRNLVEWAAILAYVTVAYLVVVGGFMWLAGMLR